MANYSGTIEELKNLLNTAGFKGKWTENATAHKFTTPSGGMLNWYDNTGTLQIQGKPAAKAEIEKIINHIVSNQVSFEAEKVKLPAPQPNVFIVYGHDETSRDQLEHILMKLKIEITILSKADTGGLTIIEALENHIGRSGTATIGIVLLTPDDIGYSAVGGSAAARDRARQNVILEMGMLIAKLGRTNTIILRKGDLESPSDIDGVLYIGYKNHVKETVRRLVQRLESCGCTIDHATALRIS
ncbi:MAG: DNA-binding protein [Chryseobacterium sp.]|nr:MAG: DNA-binding protein [Chryseobacterium sp.]